MDMKRLLAEKLEELNSEAVLTFGPDGDTGRIGIGLNTVASRYLGVSIAFTDEEERTAMQSLECYKSQLTAEEIAGPRAQPRTRS